MDRVYKNEKELLKKGKEIEGHSLYDLYGNKSAMSKGKNKGGIGNLLEKLHYGIENNSRKEPDVANLGIEIKSNPLRENLDGSVAPKEGVSLGMINYNEIVMETFETSDFIKKNQKVLYNMYMHRDDVPPNKRTFSLVDLIELSGSDKRIIKKEWELIQRYVKEGRADELSRSMTRYLMAVTKSANSKVRTKYGKGYEAKPRALGFKHAYIQALISNYKTQKDKNGNITLKGRIPKYFSLLENTGENDLEKAVLKKFKSFIGKKDIDIANSLDPALFKPNEKGNMNKSRWAYLTSMILTGKRKRELSKHIEEFAKSGLTVKTIRVNEDLLPKEEVSFKTLNRYDVIESDWENSNFYDEVSCPFLWVVFQQKNNGDTILKDAFFWRMGQEDLDQIGKKWKALKKMIEKGDHRDSYFMGEDSFYYLKIKDAKGGKNTEFKGKNLVKLAHWFSRKYVSDRILKSHFK